MIDLGAKIDNHGDSNKIESNTITYCFSLYVSTLRLPHEAVVGEHSHPSVDLLDHPRPRYLRSLDLRRDSEMVSVVLLFSQAQAVK
jgi:hypothetical protein